MVFFWNIIRTRSNKKFWRRTSSWSNGNSIKKSGIETQFVKNIDLDWALEDVSKLTKKYANNEYILLFPFCSKKHQNKKWPFFKDLISKLKQDYKNQYPILLAPGLGEINEANKLNAKVVLKNDQPVDIKTLISLINNAKFIISNDTGPAHIASHLDKEGIVLFGNHTSAKKVSIENYNFKAISVANLNDLNVEFVLNKIKTKLN